MNKPLIINILTLFLLISYPLIYRETAYSWTGYYTDLVFVIALSIVAFVVICGNIKNKRGKTTLAIVLKGIWVIYTIILFLGLCLFCLTPFGIDSLKIRRFANLTVEGRKFNAYFIPVGSYSGGEGVFWITESPKYFPLIEKQVYYDGECLDDFRTDTFDGQPINQVDVVEDYIKRVVIGSE
jgi:hypothetical protein